jgi:hypothetical protein
MGINVISLLNYSLNLSVGRFIHLETAFYSTITYWWE